MTPWVRMPARAQAEHAAILARLEQAVEAAACGTRLLARRPASGRDAALARALSGVLARARRDLARLRGSLPSRSPAA